MTYDSEVLSDSPAAYWPCDDGSGSSVADDSGNSRTATAAGGYSWPGAGLITGAADALDFAGTNGSLNFSPAGGTWMHGDPLTVEAIIKPDNVSSIRHIGRVEVRWEWWISATGKLSVNIYGTNLAWQGAVEGTTSLSADTVYHVAFTVSGTAVKLYVNGVEDGSGTNGNNPVTTSVSTNRSYFAYGTVPSTSRYDGEMSHLAIYPSALSASRLLAHAQAAGLAGSSADITPSTVAATASVPSPTVTVPTNATVTPSTVAATAAVPAPGVVAGDAYSSAVAADSPLFHWRLGESSGTVAQDATANDRDGAYVNTPTLGATGAITIGSDAAITLNGTSQYVQIADAAWMDVNNVTAEAWFKVATGDLVAGVNNTLVDRGNATFSLWVKRTSGNTYLYGKVLGAGSTLAEVEYTGATVGDDTWHHAVLTQDGTTTRLYLDGSEVDTAALAENVQADNQPITAGAAWAGSALSYLTGSLDEVAVYGSALSAARVLAHFNTASSPDATISATTVATVAAFPAATVGGDQNANILPGTIAATAAVPTPFTAGDDAPITATTVAAVAAFPAPTVQTITSVTTTTIDDSVGGRLLLGGYALIEPIPAVPTAPSTADVRVIKRVSETYPNPTLDDGRPT